MNTIDATTKDMREVSRWIRGAQNGNTFTVKNAHHIHGLAAGLKHGEVVIQGDAGDYVGVLNAGADILVTANAGKYAGDNMTGGTLIIQGNAGFGAGQYCYDGNVILYGDAGDFTATMNKGATIIVAGNIGDDAGTYMLAGDLIVVGDAGETFANYLICGNIYIAGDWKSLGHNTMIESLTDDDIQKLQTYFDTYQIDADPNTFSKIVAASEKPFYK